MKNMNSAKYELQLASLEEDEEDVNNEINNEKNIEEKEDEVIPYKIQVLLSGTIIEF
jgi:hypothetical protein